MDFENVAGIAVAPEAKEVFYVTNDILLNTLRRDGPIAAKSFDELHEGDLLEMSELLGTTVFLLSQGFKEVTKKNDELRIVCCNLCFNAINTFTGAASLLRDGYYLQSSILVRSVLETMATVMHLNMNPQDLIRFKTNKLGLKEVIPSAKKIVPPFGQMYGMFSETFIHIGSLHGKLQPLGPHQKDSEALDANLTFLRFSIWLIFVAVEFLFADIVQNGKYWEKIAPGQIQWRPTEAIREWQEKFLRANPPKQS